MFDSKRISMSRIGFFGFAYDGDDDSGVYVL